jgi:hypothetical protein
MKGSGTGPAIPLGSAEAILALRRQSRQGGSIPWHPGGFPRRKSTWGKCDRYAPCGRSWSSTISRTGRRHAYRAHKCVTLTYISAYVIWTASHGCNAFQTFCISHFVSDEFQTAVRRCTCPRSAARTTVHTGDKSREMRLTVDCRGSSYSLCPYMWNEDLFIRLYKALKDH